MGQWRIIGGYLLVYKKAEIRNSLKEKQDGKRNRNEKEQNPYLEKRPQPIKRFKNKDKKGQKIYSTS